MVILAGKVHISTWYNEKVFPSNWKIALSDTGWTNDELGLYWIKEVFNPNTCNRAVGYYRLLILDSHGSHNIPEFDQYCKRTTLFFFVYLHIYRIYYNLLILAFSYLSSEYTDKGLIPIYALVLIILISKSSYKSIHLPEQVYLQQAISMEHLEVLDLYHWIQLL
jgi:hypothetical protein